LRKLLVKPGLSWGGKPQSPKKQLQSTTDLSACTFPNPHKESFDMIIYGAPVSPFVRKCLVVAAVKNLKMEVVPVGLGDAKPEFLEASPFKKMPALRDGDFTISDSSAIVHYLEAKHPEPALIPAEPEERARAIWFDEFADTILVPAAGKIFFNRVVSPKFMGKPGDEEAAKQGEAEMVPLYEYLESVIPASRHLVADRLTLADIAVASPFVNAAHCGVAPDPDTYPKLTAFLADMHGGHGFPQWLEIERKVLKMG
jgi:glutathione S-transferase